MNRPYLLRCCIVSFFRTLLLRTTLFLPANLILPALQILSAAVLLATPSAAQDRVNVASTLDACLDCHSGKTAEAGFDIRPLKTQWEAAEFQPASLDAWVAIYDRISRREMPPEGGLPDGQRANFLSQTGKPIESLDRRVVAAEGRSRWRRMNRLEYQNAMRDLLSAPWLQLASMLPEDGTLHGYNKVGEALDVSHVNLARYMNAADYALREVTATSTKKPEMTKQRFYAREQAGFNRRVHYNPFNRSPERATFPLIDFAADVAILDDPERPFTVGDKDPELREREAFGVVASSYEPIEVRFTSFIAPRSGTYRLSFKGYTFWAEGESKKWWRPDRRKTSEGRRSEPVAIYSRSPPRQLRRLGDFDFHAFPSIQTLEVQLLKGESIQPDAIRLFRSRPPAWHNPLAEQDGMPGVAFQWMEVEGPMIEQWPTQGHRLLFDQLPLNRNSAGMQVRSDAPAVDAKRLINRFLAKVFREPTAELLRIEAERCQEVFQAAQSQGMNFQDSLIAAYTVALCSPEFLCFQERLGALDLPAAINRVSLFLANRPSSETLPISMDSVGSEVVQAACRRLADSLLDSPESDRFIAAFLDYWLELRSIYNTSPDEFLYPDYYLDDWLVDSALMETRYFMREMIDEDLPIKTLVQADFMHVNERLAKHYGIAGIKGSEFRKVPIASDSVRGGLLTQASVLKVTANGSTTSPVVRGAWVNERLLGVHIPPPPPSVPAIEPDTRGATTIREQLARHRADESCNGCHQVIDPAGFALESFDVVGGFRSRYRVLPEDDQAARTETPENETQENTETGKKANTSTDDAGSDKTLRLQPVEGFGKNGQPFQFSLGPPVDPSGVLPDGNQFSDVRQLKNLLAADERQLAHNFLSQLITFSTGAPPRFSDRAEMGRILDRLQERGFPVRSLIMELVQSSIFLSK